MAVGIMLLSMSPDVDPETTVVFISNLRFECCLVLDVLGHLIYSEPQFLLLLLLFSFFNTFFGRLISSYRLELQ